MALALPAPSCKLDTIPAISQRRVRVHVVNIYKPHMPVLHMSVHNHMPNQACLTVYLCFLFFPVLKLDCSHTLDALVHSGADSATAADMLRFVYPCFPVTHVWPLEMVRRRGGSLLSYLYCQLRRNNVYFTFLSLQRERNMRGRNRQWNS